MRDLETAKKRLEEKRLTLSIVKDGDVIFETGSRGISGFLEAVERLGSGLEEASIADRVVGKAIALLCVYAKVKAAYAIILSEEAKSLLEKYGVYHEWDSLVESILDLGKTGMCPFERLATEISDPKDAYRRLKALQSSLKSDGREPMSGEHERFILEKDEELRRIREKKLGQLMELSERGRKLRAEPVRVTDSNFSEIVNRHSLVLIDCWAPWCGPCLALAPTIEELAEEYAGRALFGKLNVDENPSTAECFQIFSIPTTLIMKNGREVDRIVGLVPKKYIEAALKKQLG
jgi:thioredoxin 1